MRLIDDPLWGKIILVDSQKLQEILDKIEPLDVAPVVRCKDCKHRFECEKFPNCCDVLMEMSHWLVEIPVKDEWHCGSGEMKEE